MELIIKEFLADAECIANSSVFSDDNSCEPKTEWIEEIDSRTNFPFYWNSDTKESVWDMPKEYNDYMIKYEAYLRDLIAKCEESKQLELETDNNQINIDMKGLIEYSDSEEDEIQTNDEDNSNNSPVKQPEEIVPEASQSPEIVEETEEDLLMKKEQWMTEQVEEADKYLKTIIKKMSETLKNKIKVLIHDGFGNESLRDISIQVKTRLEDWSEGHLSLDRKVDKLRESLIEMSRFEASLEADKWKLQWNSDKNQYLCVSASNGKLISELSATKGCCEEGEIIEDEDDLALDLEEYVCTTLHRSLLEGNQEKEQNDELSTVSRVDINPNQPISVEDSPLGENLQESDSFVPFTEAADSPQMETEDVIYSSEGEINVLQ